MSWSSSVRRKEASNVFPAILLLLKETPQVKYSNHVTDFHISENPPKFASLTLPFSPAFLPYSYVAHTKCNQ